MMPSLKMWHHLPLTILLLLFITHTASEVVELMTDCKGFLLDNRPPQVPGILVNDQINEKDRYKVICQTYNNRRRFVTLYDTENKIPVLSAYKFSGAKGGKLDDNSWKIEPQLEDKTQDINMQECIMSFTYNQQASSKDYEHVTIYNKGHLFPKSYAESYDDKVSTLTLTNSVPQYNSFNGGSWAKMETCVKCIMEKYCISDSNLIESYLMTGAVPSTAVPSRKLNDRVNVPSLLWSAFCCYSKNLNKWIASAYWGENVEDKPENRKTRTLKELYEQLKIENKDFNAFPKTKCPLDQTVDDLYSQVKKTCDCVNNPQG